MCAYELAVTAGTESLRIDEVCVCMRARARERASERARFTYGVCKRPDNARFSIEVSFRGTALTLRSRPELGLDLLSSTH